MSQASYLSDDGSESEADSEPQQADMMTTRSAASAELGQPPPADSVGARLLGKMGYQGGGLGARGQGRETLVADTARTQHGRAGLGAQDDAIYLPQSLSPALEVPMSSAFVLMEGPLYRVRPVLFVL